MLTARGCGGGGYEEAFCVVKMWHGQLTVAKSLHICCNIALGQWDVRLCKRLVRERKRINRLGGVESVGFDKPGESGRIQGGGADEDYSMKSSG